MFKKLMIQNLKQIIRMFL